MLHVYVCDKEREREKEYLNILRKTNCREIGRE